MNMIGVLGRRAVLVLLGLVLSTAALAQAPASGTVILSTTTSTQDSGLLDVLVPVFERRTGYTVKTISVGTGQALTLAARGEADVTLAHAPALEKKYVSEGKMRTADSSCTTISSSRVPRPIRRRPRREERGSDAAEDRRRRRPLRVAG